MKLSSKSPQETEDIGFKVGSTAKSFDIFCLKGELGAGKTVFVRGFTRGLGYYGEVTSPTFTLVNEYEGGVLPIYHFDLYRIERPNDLESIGWDDYIHGDGVSIIEWADKAGEMLPGDCRVIEINHGSADDPNSREICIK